MEKPKVLHISTARSWRGGEQQIAYLASELKALNWPQHIACIKDSPLHQWTVREGIEALPLKKRSSLDLGFSRKLKKYTEQHAIKVWHAHDAHAHGFAVYAKALFSAKAKLIVSRRVDFPVARSILSRFKYNHPGVSRYLAVSKAIAKILKDSIKEPEKVFTVHSSIDISKFEGLEHGIFRKEFPAHADKFWVLNVAALAGHKDQATFIKTASKLLEDDPQFHFFIAGSGKMEMELKQLTKDLGLQEQISFLGFREDVPAILKDCDCFLFTSEMEGLGTSVLDAFAAKIPVVATAAGGIPEMVIDQQTGLLNAVKDVDALANSVKRLKNDGDLGRSLSENAYQKLQEFLPNQMAEKTVKHYLN